jgi:hypothetical protein
LVLHCSSCGKSYWILRTQAPKLWLVLNSYNNVSLEQQALGRFKTHD